MKQLAMLLVALVVLGAGAAVYHRSFRNGYPAGAQAVVVRQPQNAAALKAPKTAKAKTKVVTNRVAITREQAEKLLQNKQRYRRVGDMTKKTEANAK